MLISQINRPNPLATPPNALEQRKAVSEVVANREGPGDRQDRSAETPLTTTFSEKRRVEATVEIFQQPNLPKSRPFSSDEARTAEPVQFNHRGIEATQVFSQIQNFEAESALIDTFV